MFLCLEAIGDTAPASRRDGGYSLGTSPQAAVKKCVYSLNPFSSGTGEAPGHRGHRHRGIVRSVPRFPRLPRFAPLCQKMLIDEMGAGVISL